MKLRHLIILASLMSQSFSAFAQVEKTKMGKKEKRKNRIAI